MLNRWAIFLDRDGVINQEVNYLGHPNQLELIPGAAQAIRHLNQLKIPVIVVTNQAGVARGYFSESDVDLVHQALSNLLGQQDAKIDKIYYCPHHPTAGLGDYLSDCSCRKPNPGMLHQAALEFDLNLSNCYLVGDKASDILAGAAAGCQTILVKTGHGNHEWTKWQEFVQPHFLADSILEATEWILQQQLVIS